MTRIKSHRTTSFDSACLTCREKLNLKSQFTAKWDDDTREWVISYPLVDRNDLPRTGPKEVT